MFIPKPWTVCNNAVSFGKKLICNTPHITHVRRVHNTIGHTTEHTVVCGHWAIRFSDSMYFRASRYLVGFSPVRAMARAICSPATKQGHDLVANTATVTSSSTHLNNGLLFRVGGIDDCLRFTTSWRWHHNVIVSASDQQCRHTPHGVPRDRICCASPSASRIMRSR